MNKYQELFKQLQKEKESIPQGPDDHLMIFDGLNTFIRSFSATPSTNEDGEHIGGITGFLYSIGKCVRDFNSVRKNKCLCEDARKTDYCKLLEKYETIDYLQLDYLLLH